MSVRPISAMRINSNKFIVERCHYKRSEKKTFLAPKYEFTVGDKTNGKERLGRPYLGYNTNRGTSVKRVFRSTNDLLKMSETKIIEQKQKQSFKNAFSVDWSIGKHGNESNTNYNTSPYEQFRNDSIIIKVNLIKDLDILFPSSLSFSDHLQEIVTKTSRTFSFLFLVSLDYNHLKVYTFHL